MRRQSPIVLSLLLSVTLLLFYSVSFASAAPGYSDEFSSSTLQSFWTFTDPLGTSSYSLTANPGYLRITSPTGNGFSGTSNYNAPRVLQPVTGDFVATTSVSGTFSESGFRGGLLIYETNNDYFRLEKYGSNQVLMYGYIGGSPTYQAASTSSPDNPLYLKLERTGTTLAGYWSSDGVSWNLVKQYTTNFASADSLEIGLFTISVGSTSFSADFAWFHITPEGLSVLPESPLGVLALPAAVLAAYAVYRLKPFSGKPWRVQ